MHTYIYTRKDDRYMNGVIVLFGASGDLAKRKILPALYHLMAHNILEKCIIVGVGLEALTVEQLLARARVYVEQSDDTQWQQLQSRMVYYSLNVSVAQDFTFLQKEIIQLEQMHALSGNRLFYLAIAPHFFDEVTYYLAQSGLASHITNTGVPWHRIVYEKPFGHDLQSARVINNQIRNHFDETQIYRMDHYLTKELVSNIALVRFTNSIFQPLWNKQYIDQIHIILDETGGIEGRGSYYDYYGATRDVVQNHLLQLLALIAMEAPEKLESEHIRNARVKVLEKVRFIDGMLGQYEGYLQEKDVKNGSTTETFALLSVAVDTPTWTGVPFYLRTGKNLNNNEVAIHIKFKKADCLLMRGCPLDSNWLTFTISPEATFSLRLHVKKPGAQDTLIPVDMAFCHSCIFGMRSSQAYEVLLQEVMQGQQTSAVRSDEIELAWRLIDTIQSKSLPLFAYPKNSGGPTQVEEYVHKWGIQWQKK